MLELASCVKKLNLKGCFLFLKVDLFQVSFMDVRSISCHARLQKLQGIMKCNFCNLILVIVWLTTMINLVVGSSLSNSTYPSTAPWMKERCTYMYCLSGGCWDGLVGPGMLAEIQTWTTWVDTKSDIPINWTHPRPPSIKQQAQCYKLQQVFGCVHQGGGGGFHPWDILDWYCSCYQRIDQTGIWPEAGHIILLPPILASYMR